MRLLDYNVSLLRACMLNCRFFALELKCFSNYAKDLIMRRITGILIARGGTPMSKGHLLKQHVRGLMFYMYM